MGTWIAGVLFTALVVFIFYKLVIEKKKYDQRRVRWY